MYFQGSNTALADLGLVTHDKVAGFRDGMLAYGALAGASYLAGQVSKGGLTGRTQLHHGTRSDLADTVREEGVRPGADVKVQGVTDILSGKVKDDSRGLAFASTQPQHARVYAEQADLLKGPFSRPVPKGFKTKEVQGIEMNPRQQQFQEIVNKHMGRLQAAAANKNHPGVVSINAPLWEMEMVENPEYASAVKRIKDSSKKNIMAGIMEPSLLAQAEHALKDTVRATPEGFGPEYIEGSSKYRKLTPKEFMRYVRARPGTFSKNVGAAVGAAGLTAYSGAKILQGIRAMVAARR